MTYENIRKIATGLAHGYLTGSFNGLKSLQKIKIIATDLSKLQLLEAGLKAIPQINFTANLD